jgi:hypothetical protein
VHFLTFSLSPLFLTSSFFVFLLFFLLTTMMTRISYNEFSMSALLAHPFMTGNDQCFFSFWDFFQIMSRVYWFLERLSRANWIVGHWIFAILFTFFLWAKGLFCFVLSFRFLSWSFSPGILDSRWPWSWSWV